MSVVCSIDPENFGKQWVIPEVGGDICQTHESMQDHNEHETGQTLHLTCAQDISKRGSDGKPVSKGTRVHRFCVSARTLQQASRANTKTRDQALEIFLPIRGVKMDEASWHLLEQKFPEPAAEVPSARRAPAVLTRDQWASYRTQGIYTRAQVDHVDGRFNEHPSAQSLDWEVLATDPVMPVPLPEEARAAAAARVTHSLPGMLASSAEAATSLLRSGAPADARDNNGATALMIAAGRGSPAALLTVRALLEGVRRRAEIRADLAVQAVVRLWDQDGNTALFYAIQGVEGSTELGASQISIIKSLVEAGALVNQANLNGDTPLMLAAQKDGLVNRALYFLLQWGANPLRRNRHGRTVFHHMVSATQSYVRLSDSLRIIFLDEWADYSGLVNLDRKDKNGRTALMDAAEQGNEAFVNALLRYGADVQARDLSGRDALALCSGNCSARLVRELESANRWAIITRRVR